MLAIARSSSGGAVLRGALVRRRDVEHALGFGGQIARQVEARELELRRRALRVARPAAARDQLLLPVAEVRLAIEAPGLRIEREQSGPARRVAVRAPARRPTGARPRSTA